MWHIHRLCVQFSTFVLPKKYQKLNHKSVQENKSFKIKSQIVTPSKLQHFDRKKFFP